jgi:acyl-CoA synthetase (AMP-forming)/AMP-acid ligase II
MQLTIHAAVSAAARRNPDAAAVEHDGGILTYASLETRSKNLGGALRGSGLDTGDRVLIMLGNTPWFFIAVLACSRSGLVAVPVPTGISERELDHFMSDSGARAVIVADAVAERFVDPLSAAADDGVAVLAWGSSFRRATAASELSDIPSSTYVDSADESLAFFVGYTSGTTGRPKGAVISQRARTLLAMTLGQEYGCYHAGGRALIATPLYHGAGMNRAMAPLMCGGTVVLHERFDAEHVDRLLRAGTVGSVFMVPTMFAAIAETGPAPASATTVTIMSNAAALPEKLKLFALDRWPSARLFEIYGSTEGGTISSLRPEDLLRKPRCVGQALAMTQVRIVGDDAQEVARGEPGLLWTRSPYLFTGYLGQPEATAEVMSSDGFVTSGDLAVMDEEGYLSIVGRKTDTIITGGVNVFPREVEEVIREHPAVADAVVVGIPDDRWGERVHAVVIPDPGSSITPEELEAHCARLLSKQKMPKGFDVRSGVPRTGTGKIIRAELVREIAERDRSSGADAATAPASDLPG